MGSSKSQRIQQTFLSLIGLPILSLFTTLLLIAISGFVIDGLPRSMQGEAVLAPWWACVAGSLAVSFVLPWTVSLFVFRDRLRRLYFLACLVISNSLCHLFVGSVMLTEAYNRGL